MFYISWNFVVQLGVIHDANYNVLIYLEYNYLLIDSVI